ncbi:hypothetical protein LTR28_008661 [Elasticomyces elasticus]|nr:hypothetical protein LTR28_008661 [Elasticomyces elasticus]
MACAYWSGNAANPVYCFNGGDCKWWTSEHYLACCSTDTAGAFISSRAKCAPATGCVDYSLNWLSASIADAVTTSNNVLCLFKQYINDYRSIDNYHFIEDHSFIDDHHFVDDHHFIEDHHSDSDARFVAAASS